MKDVNPVRETTLYVVESAKNVQINRKKIKELAKKWFDRDIKVPARSSEDILDIDDVGKVLDYLILLDTVNFCFWPSYVKAMEWQALSTRASDGRFSFKTEFSNVCVQKEKWSIEYYGKKYDGYFAMSLALKRFFEENLEKANFKYFSEVPFKDFVAIFKGRGELQFLKERWNGAKAISRVFLEKYGGDSMVFVESAEGKFSILVPKILEELPTFDDLADYRGRKIYFLKRAQILAADICFAFKKENSSANFSGKAEKGIGYFDDLDYLTAMADYKLPQILQYYRVLEYSSGLEKKIENKILISAGSEEEVEIRAATVWAVEYLKEELAALGKNFYSYEIDWILWVESQKEKMKNNYHLTKTIYY